MSFRDSDCEPTGIYGTRYYYIFKNQLFFCDVDGGRAAAAYLLSRSGLVFRTPEVYAVFTTTSSHAILFRSRWNWVFCFLYSGHAFYGNISRRVIPYRVYTVVEARSWVRNIDNGGHCTANSSWITVAFFEQACEKMAFLPGAGVERIKRRTTNA